MAHYDFSSYTTAELTADLAAAKKRLSELLIVGAVQSGSGVGNSFTMIQGQIKDLKEYIAALSAQLGHGTTSGGARVRPAFTCRG